jgi:Leucine-rich repeat (LRR) protein
LIFTLFFVILVAETIFVTANTISCSKIETNDWAYLGRQKTCWIDSFVSISTPGYQINSTRDETIISFNAASVKAMCYLPDSPSDIFPNLQMYQAYGSSVKTISANYFNDLKKLRYLSLGSNQIEVIENDAFDHLESLEWLHLSKKILCSQCQNVAT